MCHGIMDHKAKTAWSIVVIYSFLLFCPLSCVLARSSLMCVSIAILIPLSKSTTSSASWPTVSSSDRIGAISKIRGPRRTPARISPTSVGPAHKKCSTRPCACASPAEMCAHGVHNTQTHTNRQVYSVTLQVRHRQCAYWRTYPVATSATTHSEERVCMGSAPLVPILHIMGYSTQGQVGQNVNEHWTGWRPLPKSMASFSTVISASGGHSVTSDIVLQYSREQSRPSLSRRFYYLRRALGRIRCSILVEWANMPPVRCKAYRAFSLNLPVLSQLHP